MANEPETTNPPQQYQFSTGDTSEQNRIARIADEAAARARNGKTAKTRNRALSQGVDLREWHEEKGSYGDRIPIAAIL